MIYFVSQFPCQLSCQSNTHTRGHPFRQLKAKVAVLMCLTFLCRHNVATLFDCKGSGVWLIVILVSVFVLYIPFWIKLNGACFFQPTSSSVLWLLSEYCTIETEKESEFESQTERDKEREKVGMRDFCQFLFFPPQNQKLILVSDSAKLISGRERERETCGDFRNSSPKLDQMMLCCTLQNCSHTRCRSSGKRVGSSRRRPGLSVISSSRQTQLYSKYFKIHVVLYFEY